MFEVNNMNRIRKPNTSTPKLKAPVVAKPGHVTEAQRQRANNDRSLVHQIMSEPAPRWMQVGGSAGPRR
jgi:hypothetical protein